MNRAIAALVGFVFVLASLFGFAHEAATLHVRCAEHGELIHGEAAPATTSATHDHISRGGQPAGVRGHEHCGIASAMRESRVAPHVPAVVIAPASIDTHATAPAAATVLLRALVYRNAPKTSPPATLA